MQGREAGPPQPVRAGDPVAPDGYRLVEQRRVLGSVVRAAWSGPDGDELEWTSRGYRKGRQPRTRAAGSAAAYRRPPLFGFAPHVLSWWVAMTFTIGSVFFVVGAAGAVTGPTRWWPNAMYFVGSLLFTTGASLQLREISLTGRDLLLPPRPKPHGLRRYWLFRPGRLDWNASAIQLIGTILFNVNCLFGMSMSLTHRQEDMRVWVPSTIASVCFVSSSWLSLVEAEGRWFSWRPRQLEWWITVGSLLGSWGFLLSSLAGFFLGGQLESVVTGLLGPHGEALWLEYAVDGVLLVGSLWFLVNTYLMIPEALGAARESSAAQPRGGQTGPAAGRRASRRSSAPGGRPPGRAP